MTSGILNLSRNFGFILGAGAVSAVFWTFTRVETESGVIGFAMAGTFAICCALTLGVALLTIYLHRNQDSIP